MRPIRPRLASLLVVPILALAACGGGPPDPRVIPGGGVGDGEIDGTVNVYVIDEDTDAPIAGAMVDVGGAQLATDADGLAVFEDVEGPQVIAAKATGYRSTVWHGANGANVTIPMPPTAPVTVPQATLTGTISGWETITVGTNHVKAALVFYSWSDALGDASNELQTPNQANICGFLTPASCDWTLVSRAGAVTIAAVIVDRDTKGTAMETDDTQAVIGWAVKTGLTVEDRVNQTGVQLTLVEAGNLENVTVDFGTPPAGLPQTAALIGVEVGADEVVQMPLLDATTRTLLVAKPSVFAAGASYRLTAIAQTTSGDQGAQSILLRRGLSGPTLAAGSWVVPPTGVAATRSSASWTPSAGATAHNVAWEDATGQSILEITMFDLAATTVNIPALVALPASGTLTGRVAAIGADIDLSDFSLEEEEDSLWGIGAEPVNVP